MFTPYPLPVPLAVSLVLQWTQADAQQHPRKKTREYRHVRADCRMRTATDSLDRRRGVQATGRHLSAFAHIPFELPGVPRDQSGPPSGC